MKDPKDDIHKGHRERMRQKVFEQGLDGFAEHEVLEFLLFSVYPVKNTNDIAHALLKRFIDLKGVFSADLDELMEVKDVGRQAATFIKAQNELFRYYLKNITKSTGTVMNGRNIGQFVMNLFMGYGNEEVLYMICLNDKNCIISADVMGRGSLRHIGVQKRKIITTAVKRGAGSVILAHNHPGGIPVPSQEDIEATRMIELGLDCVEVRLWDHLIIADGRFSSLVTDCGYERISGRVW